MLLQYSLFLLLSGILLYGHITVYLSIHLFDRHLGCFQQLHSSGIISRRNESISVHKKTIITLLPLLDPL